MWKAEVVEGSGQSLGGGQLDAEVVQKPDQELEGVALDGLFQVIEQIYAAFAAQDLDAVLALAAPNVVLTQDAGLPWGGHHQGHDGAAEFVLKLVGALDSVVTPEKLFAAGDDVVQVGRTAGTVRASGARFDVPECHVWTVRDGRIVRAQFFIDSAAMLEAIRR